MARKKAINPVADGPYHALFRLAQVGMFLIRLPERKMEEANPCFAMMLGYRNREDLLREFSWERHFTHARLEEALLDPDLADHAGHFEVPMLRRDGTRIWTLFSLGIDASGGLQGVVVDITGQKTLEQQILRISDEQRQRFGAELHDGLGQILTGTSFLCHSLARDLGKDGSPGVPRVREIGAMVRQAAQQARDLSHDLLSGDVAANRLGHALKELGTSIRNVFKIPCEVVVQAGIHPFDREAATHLLRLAQEALHNAVRHSGTQLLELALSREDDHGVLSIRDHGRGLPRRKNASGGVGMRLMRFRARLIGGGLKILSSPKGLIIRCCFPLSERRSHGTPDR